MTDIPLCPSCHIEMVHIIDDIYVCRHHRIYRVRGRFVGENGKSKIVGQDDVVGFNFQDMWINTITRLKGVLDRIDSCEAKVHSGVWYECGMYCVNEDAKELLRRWKE